LPHNKTKVFSECGAKFVGVMVPPVQCVVSENPLEFLRESFLVYETEETARRFLKERYRQIGVKGAERVAFRNVQTFIAWIRQAVGLFQSARGSGAWARPLLLYSGMMSFFKAWILTIDTGYPQTASVLRHGLSTRKKKSGNFSVLDEEIRMQKEGLFPLAARLAGTPIPSGEGYTFRELLSFLPDLCFRFPSLNSHSSWIRTEAEDGGLCITPEELVRLGMTPTSLYERLSRMYAGCPWIPGIAPTADGREMIRLLWRPAAYDASPPPRPFVPGLSVNMKGDHYLWIGNNRPLTPPGEWIAFGMLFFSLSMLCRYDPLLWSEIIFERIRRESVLIEPLLALAERKFPQLVLEALREERLVLFIR
jgi:hypothetical protein